MPTATGLNHRPAVTSGVVGGPEWSPNTSERDGARSVAGAEGAEREGGSGRAPAASLALLPLRRSAKKLILIATLLNNAK